MNNDVFNDRLVVIQIDGMHCENCEEKIKKALLTRDEIYEVEVDFNSAQASILYGGPTSIVAQLMDIIRSLGYRPTGFALGPEKSESQPQPVEFAAGYSQA